MGNRLARRVWGERLPGFTRIRRDRDRLIMVLEGLDPDLMVASVLRPLQREGERSPLRGRAALRPIELENGDAALVRSYQHGGLFQHFTGETFFTWPARPFKELAVTEAVRLRGISTLDVLAAVVERSWGPLYRGWLVTRRLTGAEDLWMALQSGTYVGSEPLLLRAVARGIRRMHRMGVYHGDLNLKNILVRRENREIAVYLIDFDKARLFSGEVPVEKARRNLKRLLRSVCKLDPGREWLSEGAWASLLDFYHRDR